MTVRMSGCDMMSGSRSRMPVFEDLKLRKEGEEEITGDYRSRIYRGGQSRVVFMSRT